ncbi:MAG: hypothetical protein L0Y54_10290, partial [Sporichthyaceae bacterium]|nr:hypothetical protein [Sporichthyaceae bacterium]
EGGNDIADVIRGVVTLVLSVIALPALIRLLNPIVGGVVHSGGHWMSMAYLGMSGWQMWQWSHRGGGASVVAAAEQAGYMDRAGPAATTASAATGATGAAAAAAVVAAERIVTVTRRVGDPAGSEPQ